MRDKSIASRAILLGNKVLLGYGYVELHFVQRGFVTNLNIFRLSIYNFRSLPEDNISVPHKVETPFLLGWTTSSVKIETWFSWLRLIEFYKDQLSGLRFMHMGYKYNDTVYLLKEQPTLEHC